MQSYGWKLALGNWLVLGGAITSLSFASALLENSAIAQILPDATLPNNSSVTTQDNITTISGGTKAGANLFHSFEQFSVPTDATAHFNNATDIQNIISRVTGGSISNLDGLIRANGTANLFLLNPNGIIFGSNAALNIGGSFVASTASSIKFADGFQFSANPQNPSPLLTISVPVGLQLGSNPGKIVNSSRATNSLGEIVGLSVQPGATLGLVGGEVAIAGGHMTAKGGRIELGSMAADNAVSLVSANSGWLLDYQNTANFQDISVTDNAKIAVNGDGRGSININANNIDLLSQSKLQAGIDSNFQFLGDRAGEIALNARGNVSVDNATISNQGIGIGNADDINIAGRSVFFTNGSQLFTNSQGQGNAGNIAINALDTALFDGVSSSGEATILAANLNSTARGNGGKIAINAESVFLSNGAEIIAHTEGQGNAGSVTINASDTISIDGVGSNGFSSGVGSQVFRNAVGNGGAIALNAPKITVSGGANIVAHTEGQGNAGSITINANDIFLDGVGSNGESSGLGSAAFGTARGNAGEIKIDTHSLTATNSASLFVASFGQGDAGSVTINAKGAVSFDGVGLNGRSSNAFSTLEQGSTGNGREINITANSLSLTDGAAIGTATNARGNGGNIKINVNTLNVLNGGQILTTSRNGGNAGNITVGATDSITLSGSDPTYAERLGLIGRPVVRNQGAASGLFADTDAGSTGSGGNINVRARSLSISNGALLNANSSGQGIAGDIEVDSRSIELDNKAGISVTAASGNGGNISLKARNLLTLRRGSQISTTAGIAGAGGDGGNISIDNHHGFIIAAPNENSDITANAFNGLGGSIRIDSASIFGMQQLTRSDLMSLLEADNSIRLDPQQLATNNITAFSQTSPDLSGTININTPEVELNPGLVNLPSVLVTTEVSQACQPRTGDNPSQFIITGRGGLPPNPNDVLTNNNVQVDWVALDSSVENSAIDESRGKIGENWQNAKAVKPSQKEIVEAQGWISDSNGNITLVAQAPTSTPDNAWSTPATCSVR